MRKIFQTSAIALGLALLLLVAPLKAHAGVADILSLLTTITGTLRNSIGQVLSGIRQLESDIRLFEQQAIWPVTLIDQAKASVTQVRSQYSALAGQVHSIKVASATLAHPSRLEALVRGSSRQGLNQLTSAYADVFLALPQQSQATSAQRNLIDADDAFALGAMKAATLSEQQTASQVSLAERLEQEASVSAPGSAAILAAEAQVANLENQAMLQKMLAEELRQEAGALAHQNALRKQSADDNRALRNNLLHTLGRR